MPTGAIPNDSAAMVAGAATWKRPAVSCNATLARRVYALSHSRRGQPRAGASVLARRAPGAPSATSAGGRRCRVWRATQRIQRDLWQLGAGPARPAAGAAGSWDAELSLRNPRHMEPSRHEEFTPTILLFVKLMAG